ncbi:unnamed protein product [Protopolystoma xenopodis]|uniref:Uncharacterized protein n=1 Tax=Protopolystoma xenopodis TaxID=117903 RepID=A0A3S5AHC8_9PLAT|nr:unnamed protein product [Protopolystoma xenopodis]
MAPKYAEIVILSYRCLHKKSILLPDMLLLLLMMLMLLLMPRLLNLPLLGLESLPDFGPPPHLVWSLSRLGLSAIQCVGITNVVDVQPP